MPGSEKVQPARQSWRFQGGQDTIERHSGLDVVMEKVIQQEQVNPASNGRELIDDFRLRRRRATRRSAVRGGSLWTHFGTTSDAGPPQLKSTSRPPHSPVGCQTRLGSLSVRVRRFVTGQNAETPKRARSLQQSTKQPAGRTPASTALGGYSGNGGSKVRVG